MLRITVREEDSKWVMKLEGRLAEAWVGEAHSAWALAPAGRAREVDVHGLAGTDEAGRRLLCAMHRDGATFSDAGLVVGDLIRKLGQGLATFALAVTILVGGIPAKAQSAPVRLTLKDAVVIAQKQNPQVAIANLNMIESQVSGDVARSALLPHVSLSASDEVTRGNSETLFGRRIPGFPGHNGPFWAIQAGPAFSVPLFDLTLLRRWQAAKAQVGVSIAQETTARELNAQLVVSQYLGALRASADVDAAKSRLDLANALTTLAADMQKAGVGTGIDTLRSRVQVQNETQRYTEAGTQLKVSMYGLGRLLNLDPQQTIELADGPSFFETPAFDADGSLARALEARPEMKALIAQVRTAELQKRAAKAQRMPKLSINGGWNLQGTTPNRMIPAYQYGATVEVPLFTGGRIEAETAIADIEIRKLVQVQSEARNQIALEVKTALAQLDSARVEVEAANLGVTLSKETVRQAQDRFRAGVVNNIEVITAQDELARANDNQIKALYRYNQSRADLAHATGQMEQTYSK